MKKSKSILPSVLFVAFFVFSAGISSAQVNPICVSATASAPGFATNFDTLASTGTSGTVPPGIGFVETDTNANSLYTAGTGSDTTGDTYSFGSTGSTDRAFGGVLSGTLTTTIGACIVNNTGGVLNAVNIVYDGEQWRLGTAGRADRLDFEYSTNATSLTTGTWTAVDALDFSSPNTAASIGALDGNAAANRTAGIASTITGLTIASGARFYIRFLDFNASGSDDGLAVDNFSMIGLPSLSASANVGGRVADNNGNGLAKVRVKISGGELSEPIYAMTNPFGYFNFEVPVGQTYVVAVQSKQYNFSNPIRLVNVNDNVTELSFIANEK